ncbi:SGNH/GDSL hydrolase family protein [Maribacter sp. ACAM166]|uniref:SGNH/GDSL hydrolase family protein n=1 Tax=Maribacter sp. ACAM166 TaxID=2508996 RepID=UPI0010FF28A8|nr:SGNH/GDSL hydrolase family protein [Maribacter sp. ACAM166]TLP80373.1 G-D-S-L family lipolytic protein [Maribacter sp. ACAM166]
MQHKNRFYKLLNFNKLRLLSLSILFCGFLGFSQAENNFTNEVKKITEKYDTIWNSKKETIVFTGSSSVRLWKKLEQSFPNHQILNTGFGGSQASDLLHFLNDLVLTYNPKKVFIYEGDNDLWAKKRPNQVIHTTEEIIRRIKANNPTTQIILIAAKPSISRWRMRGKYKRLNRKMKRLTEKDPLLSYVDVWYPMLTKNKLKTDIFIEDGLHMNQKGYDIWYQTMMNLVNNPQ